ncbi:MAG: ferritin-like domain-containing protein [Candidatus Eremiobacteraeota bacterium]|nr:ferritin-like domain-containing protein [Candidatus Eremiobacteraeota bacterium]
MRFIKDVATVRARAREHIDQGPVTKELKINVEEVCKILNEALATELVCILRYQHHYYMASGIHGPAVKAEMKEHWEEEQRHANILAERIQQLGGVPDFSPEGLSKSHTEYEEGNDLADMVREDLIAERIVCQTYAEIIRYLADKDPTSRTLMEEILRNEEEHADDLSELLFSLNPTTGKTTHEWTGNGDPKKVKSRK